MKAVHDWGSMARFLMRAGLLFALLLTLGCRTPATRPPDLKEPASPAPIRIPIVATNDLHGWLVPNEHVRPDGVVVREGGLAVFSSYLSILRAQNPGGLLLLDGGDIFQGTLASNLTEGAAVIDAYNALGYTAAAIGNHEFDYGPEGPISVTRDGLDPFGALKARMAQANFPILSVNVYEAESGKRPEWLEGDGTKIIERAGVKIGLLGLTTPSTPETTNPVNVASLRFGELAPETLAAAARLRERGAEVVIAVAHAGGRCPQLEDPNDLTGCDLATGEIFGLMQKLPPGTLDAVVAGHTHQPLAHFVNGTPVIETGGLGRSFAYLELYVDPKTRHVLDEKTVLAPPVSICATVDSVLKTCEVRKLRRAEQVTLVPATFRGQPISEDPLVQAAVAPALTRVREEQERRLGVQVEEPLGRRYDAESALGSFLADSLREVAGVDVSLLNPGGLRSDLPAGELTYGEVYEVIPFDNTISIVTLNGAQLEQLLKAAYGAHKGVFQVSGLEVSLAACAGPERLKAARLVGGKQIHPKKQYRVVLPDFLARGGDGLGAVLSTLPPQSIDLGSDRELNFRDALVAHWQQRGTSLVAPKPGRITLVGDTGGCAASSSPGH